MIKRTYSFLSSLDLSFWLLSLIMAVMAIASFTLGEGSRINEIALFRWLSQSPATESWWVWIVMALIALLAANTLFCSADTIVSRFNKGGFFRLIAPQLMHAGFLLIALAHLLSASGGAKEGGQVYQGMTVQLPDNSAIRFDSINVTTGMYGMPTDYSAKITHLSKSGSKAAEISPNHPWFNDGYALYLKQAENGNPPFGIVELHKEPGAGAALAGGVLFTIGNLLLLYFRKGRED